jgi:ribosomal protein S12 methylthiotransferase
MTGFPGEDEEDFAELLNFQENLKLDWLGCFAYSREEDTPAYSMKKRVAKKLAVKRKSIIEEKQIPISEKQMDRFVGREFTCLVEEKVEGEDGLYLGRLPCQAPDVDGSTVLSSNRELVPGTFVKGRVFARTGIDLEFKVI